MTNKPESAALELSPVAPGIRVAIGHETQAGRRDQNDDRIGAFVPEDPVALALKGIALVLCDGVSAADAGGDAADSCVRGFLADYFSTPESWSVETSAKTILNSLNRSLYGKGQSYRDPQRGFLCTLTALVLKSRTGYLFHVGDCRAYRFREGKLEQLTRDHRLQISDDSSYLSRVMGLDLKVEIDHVRFAIEQGDVYLLSSDGLHTFVDETALQAACATPDLERAARELVALALSRGSDDNASCQLVRIEALPSPTEVDVHTALSALPLPPLLSPGMVIDGYRVVRRIHESPRSQLYAVVDDATGRQLVMKTPSVLFEDDPAYLEHFAMEPWIGSRVNSPYVIQSVIPDRRQTFLYHLQEYGEGVTLEKWMTNYPDREIGEVVRIVTQIARGLAALHRREIIHRDLKPDNVMIGPDGRVKILDLGACFVAGIQEVAHGLDRNEVLGTAPYTAPELHAGGAPRPSSDQFSLGVLAYELLTGHMPYGPDFNGSDSRFKLGRCEYTPAYHHNPRVPLWMNGALRKATRLDPGQRYAEISELVHDLSHPNPAFVNEAARPLVERNPLRFWRLLCAALVVLELLTLSYFLR